MEAQTKYEVAQSTGNPTTPTVATTPADLLQMAVSQNADLDKLEKLMALQERYEANEARKAYHKAMAAFKSDPPKIDKDRHVKYGNTEYNHATLANVTATINAALSKVGLTAGWQTKQEGNQITVSCRVTHELGHFEETSLTAGPDTSGSKNAIQAIGSAVTYLQRYTLLALTGLATHEQDNDGGKMVEPITPNQLADLMALISEVKGNVKAMCQKFKIESLDDLPASKYAEAVAMCEAKRGAANA